MKCRHCLSEKIKYVSNKIETEYVSIIVKCEECDKQDLLIADYKERYTILNKLVNDLAQQYLLWCKNGLI